MRQEYAQKMTQINALFRSFGNFLSFKSLINAHYSSKVNMKEKSKVKYKLQKSSLADLIKFTKTSVVSSLSSRFSRTEHPSFFKPFAPSTPTPPTDPPPPPRADQASAGC
ncbi:hypothetical protein KFK09_000261 [Dendrobium nobile]|uniref:Uncharacterized protein n=1 Tax=Dendrobium nobile TaxID=94219 RepID=A0A8T3CE68_DENNO|nr:hypothetical protein KFK09_000261 [Dendrobium nobile]